MERRDEGKTYCGGPLARRVGKLPREGERTPVKMRENLLYLTARQNHRRLRRALDSHSLTDEAEFAPQHLFVQKQKRVERLILCRGGNAPLDRQIAHKFGDVAFT